jgi:hypothetical protein
MQIEPQGTNLESQLTNFVRMSYFFIEPLMQDEGVQSTAAPEVVLGVVDDLLQHINKYSLILKAAGYKIDVQAARSLA